jgi:hypothetical protein
MVQTITPQNYVQGTTQKQGIVYADTTNVMFLLNDNTMVVYLEIGVIEQLIDPITEQEITSYTKLSVDTIAFTDEQMKALIDVTGTFFNSDDSNLLIAGMNAYSDTIILNDITANPNKYFGITIANWEASPTS